MPNNSFISKADSTQNYKVDDRVTVSVPLRPLSYDSYDGPTRGVVSGTRVNSSSGT